MLQYFSLDSLVYSISSLYLQNSKFHSRVLWFESEKLLNYRGSNLMGSKKFFAYYIANISNLLLHGNIDINLFANRLFLASM